MSIRMIFKISQTPILHAIICSAYDSQKSYNSSA